MLEGAILWGLIAVLAGVLVGVSLLRNVERLIKAEGKSTRCMLKATWV